MENVTHSLIGVVLGEGIARARLKSRDPREQRAGRDALLWTSVLGSNLPDFDFVMKPFLGSGNLGYLLHHRGYTHTFLLSFPLALVAACVGKIAARRTPSAVSWGLLFFTGWIAVLLHVTADFWNDYGVHPFWPAVNQWFYGDFIFIFEPLFWLCLLPFAFRIARTQSARIASIVLGGGLLAACWSGHYMSWPVALWLSAWTVLWTLVHRRKASVSAAFASIAVVLALFAVPSQIVRERLKSALPAGEELLQMVTTPSPGNPLCWRVIVSSRLAHPEGAPPTDYRARVGGVGVGQEWFRLRANDPKTCVLRAWTDNSALWAQVDAPSLHQPGMTWAGEFRGGLQEFSHLVSTHCRLRALLRFVRVPYWFASPSGSVVAGDLRYHSGSGLGFADIQSEAGEECFAHEPPWKSPSLLNNVD